MVASNALSPGMVIALDNRLYRVESSVKVTVSKGNPFIKTQLNDVTSGDLVEKSFKLNQQIEEVSLAERDLEYLYLDEDCYLFLDIGDLEQVRVPMEVIGDKVDYLKEGTKVKAQLYGDLVFAVDLPQFLELMVKSIDGEEEDVAVPNTTRGAVLETGARLKVPGFVESGDIIKVDTKLREYIQRV